MPTKDETNRAYNWAIDQEFPDKPSRYARILAETIRDMQSDRRDMWKMIEDRQHKLEKIKLLVNNNNIMGDTVYYGGQSRGKTVFLIFRIIAAKIMEIMEEG